MSLKSIDQMRLSLIISSLGCGGAERVLSTMANYWARRGWDITVITLDGAHEQPFFPLNKNVRRVTVGTAGHAQNPISNGLEKLKRVNELRRKISANQPDAVISFMDKPNLMAVSATRGIDVPVIVSERTDPAAHSIGWISDWLRRCTYPLADRVIVQTDGAVSYFSSRVRSRIRIIPNPVVAPIVDQALPDTRYSKPFVVAMGRLSHEKGFDHLLRTFALLKQSREQWTLVILGEGPMRKELESLRDQLGLAGRVFLPGQVKNPDCVLRQADLFVLSSRFEGFPNALCEAMASGLPVVSTDCRYGPREIITDGVNGLLVAVDDVDALAKAIDQLMHCEIRRKSLATRAPQVQTRFGLERVMALWDGVLEEIARDTRVEYARTRSSSWRPI